MKLLAVIDSLGAGGAERSLVELLPWLRQEGIDPTVITLRHATEGYEDEVREAGVDLRALEGRVPLTQIRELRNIIRSERPDVVHTMLISSDMIGRLAAHRTGARVMTSLVNTSYDPVRRRDPAIRRWRLELIRVADGWTARHLTDHFHAISHTVADAAVSSLHIDQERITVVARGRDATRLGKPGVQRSARARSVLALAPDDEVVVTVGRQEWQKGQHVLLEAVAAVANRRPRLIVLVAGRTGSATPALEKLAADLRVDHRVRFLGHRGDVPEILAAGDVFVFPSLYEGLGGSLIEAMALGLPVVASDLPAIREVVAPGESALLVPPGDPAALARALDTVFGDSSAAARLGARGREQFDERFTMQACAPRMIDLYRRVVA